jgi:hypothetical protein
MNSLLRKLRIEAEDFDDLIIDEDVTIDEEPYLLAVAQVLKDKSFSLEASKDTMRFAWMMAICRPGQAHGADRLIHGDWLGRHID